MYRLRGTRRYHEKVKVFAKTKATTAKIAKVLDVSIEELIK